MNSELLPPRMQERCLLIGAGGFLGRRIPDRLRKSGVQVVGTSRSVKPGDPASWIAYEFPANRIAERIGDLEFDFVIVAGPLAFPDASFPKEDDPRRASIMAREYDLLFAALNRAGRAGAPPAIAYVSSDAVFSGNKGRYLETDEPDATDASGARHLAAERSLMAHASRPLILRSAFLFDADDFRSDKRLMRLRGALMAGDRIIGEKNVFKSPVPIARAVEMIVDSTLAGRTGIVHLPGRRLSIFDFYETLIQPLGLDGFAGHVTASVGERPSDTSLASIHRPELDDGIAAAPLPMPDLAGVPQR